MTSDGAVVFPIRPPDDRWPAATPPTGVSELDLLAYRSNLLGTDRSVANWGGGNTSCKTQEIDYRGETVEVLWVKGSGSDLATIAPHQFTAIRLDALGPLNARDDAGDDAVLRYYDHAALRPGQPRPSIETPFHSLLPFTHIDHTHPDAIIALCATPTGRELAARLWGRAAIWIEYERPGFALGKKIAAAVGARNGAACVLLAKHGLITWGESAEECYRSTIATVARAAEALADGAAERRSYAPGTLRIGRDALARTLPVLRGALSRRERVVLRVDDGEIARGFADRPDVAALASAGPACPDHLIHTKPWPLVLDARDGDALREALPGAVAGYEQRYSEYVRRNGDPATSRDPAPRIIVVPGLGIVASGTDAGRARVAAALYERAMAVLSATAGLGGFEPLSERETFEIEYWPLELYKLSLLPPAKELAGRVAFVTGGASGIGRSVARRLASVGAHVVVADRNVEGASVVASEITAEHGDGRALALPLDVTDESAVRAALDETVLAYGGVDVLVCSAGIASSGSIEETSLAEWQRNIDVLATGYFLASREAFRVMRAQGIGGSIVFVGSKNALAAGRNAAAYSAAKAAELHLARCLAEEGGEAGIRVNTVNPDAVLQGSGIWSSAWREERARTYGIAPEELEEFYRRRTTLKVNVFPDDVAEAVLFFASDRSAKSTANLLNVDGGVAASYPR